MTPEILSPGSIMFSNAPIWASSAIGNETNSAPSQLLPRRVVSLEAAGSSSGSQYTAYSVSQEPVSILWHKANDRKRRRSQNQAARRALGARQHQHVETLGEKLKSFVSEYEQLMQRYTALSIVYESLLEGRGMRGKVCMMARDLKAIGRGHLWIWGYSTALLRGRWMAWEG